MRRTTTSNLFLISGLAAIVAACAVKAAPADSVAVVAMPASATEPQDVASVNVLPADMDSKARFALMKHISMSLGVRCTYCHVGEEGQPLSTFDFKSDEKWQKRRARAMMKLTHEINMSDALPGEPRASLTDMSQNRVTCYTCHGGKRKPDTIPPTPES